MVVPQEFSQTLTVECVFFAAVLTDLLWPYILGDVTVGIQQKHGYDARRCLVQNPTRPLPNLLTELFLSQIRWGWRQIWAHDQKGRVSPDQLQCPSSSCQRRRWRVDAPDVSWQESILCYGNRYPRVLGWEQRSLPPRKAVNSEFIRLGSVNW